MATVFLATDTRLERQVALKLMNRDLRDDPAFVARFAREARTVAALEHSAIVPIYDYGEVDDWLFLVMRYMKGGSLRELIARGPLPLSQAYDVVHRIGLALDEAHRMNVIHRDLKPNNILLDESGRAFLSDFGVLKVARGDTTYLTRTGETVGTYAYMSPEQVRGNELDGRSDIYALGIVLYEILTARHPFDEVAGTSGAMAIAHAQEPVPVIGGENPEVSPAVNEVIARAMAKQPADRYSTGGEMADALLEAMTKKPSKRDTGSAPPPPAVEEGPEPEQPASRPPPIIPVRQASGELQSVALPAGQKKRRTPLLLIAVAGLTTIACICLVVASPPLLRNLFQPETETPERLDSTEPGAEQTRGDLEEVTPEQPAVTHMGTLKGHTDDVNSVAFSPDGRILASGSDDRTVRLWAMPDGTLLNTLTGHTDVVVEVAFSPDGQTLASGSFDGTVRLWNVADGSPLDTLEAGDDEIQSLAYSPVENIVAAGSSTTNQRPEWQVRLWDVGDGTLINTFTDQSWVAYGLAFSPDGESLAASSADRSLRLWRVADHSLKNIGWLGADAIWDLAFSWDGEILATGSADKTIRLLRVTDFSTSNVLRASAEVSSVAFSRDGQILAAGLYDNTVRLWLAAGGDSLAVLEGHTDKVLSVAFSTVGNTLASGSVDTTIQLWEIAAD